MEDAMPAFVLHSETANPAPMPDLMPDPPPTAGEFSDERLMQDFAAGRSSAFSTLFERYRQPIFGFFRRRLSDPARAEELAQETFLAVLHAAPRYQPTALFRTWLYAIAFKILRAHRRKAAFRATFFGSPDVVPDPAVASTLDTEILIRHAVAKLDPLEREILLLREFEQLSYDEISTVLAVPLNTVRSRLFRARLALHTLLSAPSATHQKVSL